MERHGGLYQVELDALPPETLRQVYEDALRVFWDDTAYQLAVRRRGGTW
jgi:hypothetical protein